MRPHPTDPAAGDVVNASAMILVARRADTPRSRAFLAAYHAAEADVARERPHLAEQAIRDEAARRAARAMGVAIGPLPGP